LAYDAVWLGNECSDRLFGNDGDDTFDAADSKGGNRMSGNAGNDTFFLGKDDRALGGDGDDRFFTGCCGGNTLVGGLGKDQFWIVDGQVATSFNTVSDFQTGIDVIGISGAGSLGITTANL
jgi:alkaline phosphatase